MGIGRQRILSLVAAALLLVVVFPASPAASNQTPTSPYHKPIIIQNDAWFTADNGVTGGSGSPADPYVIEGWEINASDGYGVLIPGGIKSHFVLRNLIVLPDPIPASLRRSCCYGGVEIWATNGTVENVTVSGRDIGIRIAYTSDVVVSDSRVSNNSVGIEIEQAARVTLRGNLLTNNGIEILGERPADLASHQITEDNLVDGEPFRYMADCSGVELDGVRASQVFAVNCTGVRIANTLLSSRGTSARILFSQDVEITGNDLNSVHLYSVTDAIVARNNLSSFRSEITHQVDLLSNEFCKEQVYGIRIQSAFDTTISNNTFCSSRYEAIRAGDYYPRRGPVVNLTIEGNLFQGSGREAISIISGTNVVISDNIIVNGSSGISVTSQTLTVIRGNRIAETGGTAISVAGSNFLIEENVITDNGGPGLSIYKSTFAYVRGNIIERNEYGVILSDSEYATFHGNTFVGDGIWLYGKQLSYYNTHEIPVNNTVNGKPIHYVKDSSNVRFDGEPVGQLLIVNSTYIWAANLTIEETDDAILLAFVDNASVQDNHISNVTGGLRVFYSVNITAARNELTDTNGLEVGTAALLEITSNKLVRSGWVGLSLSEVVEASVIGNTLEDGIRGIGLWSVAEILVAQNTVLESTYYGISLDRAYEVTLRENVLENDSIDIRGESVEEFSTHTISTDNTVNGKPVYYYRDCSQVALDGVVVGELIVANCTRFRASNLVIEGGDVGVIGAFSDALHASGLQVSGQRFAGIEFLYSTRFTIENSTVSSVGFEGDVYREGGAGVMVHYSEGTNLTNNRIESNQVFGILIRDSASASLTGNEFAGNNFSGLQLWNASSIRVVGNTLERNLCGVCMERGVNSTVTGNIFRENEFGLASSESDSVLVARNTIATSNGSGVSVRGGVNVNVSMNELEGNAYGIFVNSSQSFSTSENDIHDNEVGLFFGDDRSSGQVTNNTIANNTLGVSFAKKTSVRVFHNRFLNNTRQAFDAVGANTWDGNYTLGGNFWSDYAGVDNCTGPNQDVCTGPDLYGDTPRAVEVPPGCPIPQDRYPLMEPTPPPPRMLPPLPPTLTNETPPGAGASWIDQPAIGAALLVAIVGGALAANFILQRGRRPPEGKP